jgi:HK97 family phage portal protein
LQSLLHDAPNPEMTALQAREAVQMALLLRGNGYWYVERNIRGDRVLGLWPLRADRVTPERLADGSIVYYHDTDKGRVTYTAGQVLHIAGMGWDGIVGKAPIDVARDAVGLGLAAQEFGGRFFGSGTHPSVVVKHPGRLSPKAFDNLKRSLADRHEGLGKAHRMMLLEEGMELKELGVSPEAAQFLETRRFQRSEIASIYRVPLVLIDSTASTAWGSGIEQLMIGYSVHCIRPWLVRWEQAINQRLLTDKERAAGYYVGHVLDAIQRGDIRSRYAAYATGRQWGWLSADDVRGLENLNPLPNGDGAVYLNPLNMVPASMYANPMPEQPQNGGANG